VTAPYKKGDAVEVRRLSGWTDAVVVTVTKLRPGSFLYQAQVPGEKFPHSYRAEQMRRPVQCTGCGRFEAENNELRVRLAQALAELRKWVETG
jgi:hypothetical protein